ncbi:MAG: hypothetical protein M3N98_04715 [Actinomycetota bacterium]|nr:hypothetical protein [Actinomycetota bacterium]
MHLSVLTWRRSSLAPLGAACLTILATVFPAGGPPAMALAAPAVASSSSSPAAKVGWIQQTEPGLPEWNGGGRAFNTTGGVNVIHRLTAGFWQITFPGLAAPGGVAEVTGNITGAGALDNCEAAYWVPSGSDELVGVRCYDENGNPFDGDFFASYTADGTGTTAPFAFARADQPSTTFYRPGLTFQYNSAGSAITVRRTSVGRYHVAIPNQPSVAGSDGTVKVTPFGEDGHLCTVVGYGPNPAGSGVRIDAACFDSTGSPADSDFTIVWARNTSIVGLDAPEWAYGLADQPSNTSVHGYTPIARDQFDSVDGGPTLGALVGISSTGVGYDMFLPNEALANVLDGFSHVTAVGTLPRICNITDESAANDHTTEIEGVKCIAPGSQSTVTSTYMLDWTTSTGPAPAP